MNPRCFRHVLFVFRTVRSPKRGAREGLFLGELEYYKILQDRSRYRSSNICEEIICQSGLTSQRNRNPPRHPSGRVSVSLRRQSAVTRVGKAYVAKLKRRRKVVEEFGVDDPCLATFIELINKATGAGSHVPTVRAHELCIRVAESANSNRKRAGGRKEVNEMSREEIIAKLRGLKLKADGESFDVDEDPRDMEFWESMGRTK